MPAALATAPPRPPGRHTHPHLPPGWADRPYLPPGWNKHPPLPAHLHPLAGGGMPGWQITQLAAAAVLLAAAVAITIYRLRPSGGARARPPPDRRATMTTSGLLPHTIQLCSHCQATPAGFWVRGASGRTVRRPWCLTCCGGLDPGRFHVIAFDTAPRPTYRRSQPGQTARPVRWPRARPPRRPPP